MFVVVPCVLVYGGVMCVSVVVSRVLVYGGVMCVSVVVCL